MGGCHLLPLSSERLDFSGCLGALGVLSTVGSLCGLEPDSGLSERAEVAWAEQGGSVFLLDQGKVSRAANVAGVVGGCEGGEPDSRPTLRQTPGNYRDAPSLGDR